MKRFVSYLATGMLASALAVPGLANAQTGGANGAAGGPVIVNSVGAPTSDLPMAQYSAFHDFRQAHPNVARALARNPKLINSESFQRRHPALRDFLSRNRGFAEDFASNPGDYVLPVRAPVRRHAERRGARAANERASANANTGGTAAKAGAANAGAGAPSNSAGASAPSNSASGPNGVPAATGNAGTGNSAGAPSSGNNM
jgi:hypothetical protein